MNIWCLCRWSRPQFLDNAISNFARQTFENKYLVLVANGSAKNACDNNTDKTSNDSIIRIESLEGTRAPFNTGLEYIKQRANNTDWICWWDDDDWYDDNYLQTIADIANTGAKASSRQIVWVKTAENKLYQSGSLQENKHHGPTLASRVDVTLEIPEHNCIFGEDGIWINAMKKSGIEFAPQPIDGFCWMRYAENHTHACPLDTKAFKMLKHFSRYFGDFDLDIVKGLKKRKGCKINPIKVRHNHISKLLKSSNKISA